jgi:hypothetical protein
MPRVNPKQLDIFVTTRDLYDSEAISAFQQKGHIVWPPDASKPDAMDVADVIIGPRCWRIDPLLKLGDDSTVEESLERQLEMMEKGVRAIKYPKKKED